MGIGEAYEFEKTGQFYPETKQETGQLRWELTKLQAKYDKLIEACGVLMNPGSFLDVHNARMEINEMLEEKKL